MELTIKVLKELGYMNEDIKDILDSRLSNFKDETLSKKIIENYNFLLV